MKERLPSEDFPLPKDQPLPPSEVVKKIGTFKRLLQTHQQGRSDFPQPVLVVTNDGREVPANLLNIFSDGASQADGTFYFDRQVREAAGTIRAVNFFWGREIGTITFLSSGDTIPKVKQDKIFDSP